MKDTLRSQYISKYPQWSQTVLYNINIFAVKHMIAIYTK